MNETKQMTLNKETLRRYLPQITLGVFLVLTVAMILVSFLALKIPVVAVCTLVILEAVLCVCLKKIPVWAHAVVVAVQVAFGFFVARGPLMICMAVVYVAAVALLYIRAREM